MSDHLNWIAGRLSDHAAAEIRSLAEENGESLSSVVQAAVRQYLNRARELEYAQVERGERQPRPHPPKRPSARSAVRYG